MSSTLRDYLELTKPRLATLVIFTAGVGILLAPGPSSLFRSGLCVLLTALLVSSGTVLNMVLERGVDGRMRRTAQRPLPTGRLRPGEAAVFGIALGLISLPLLAWKVNLLTAGLGLSAWTIYLFAYTPLKRRSVAAVYVGALPGATPILMGWTSVTGALDAPGLALFAILFLWQIPHFIAISLFRREEYAAAGLKILPEVYGERASIWHMLGTCVGLVIATLLPVHYGIGGILYEATAVALASTALLGTLYGMHPQAGRGWARRYFLVTLLYLPLLLGMLVVDHI